MTENQLKALMHWVECKIIDMQPRSDLSDSIQDAFGFHQNFNHSGPYTSTTED